jgi:hypothetical protein
VPSFGNVNDDDVPVAGNVKLKLGPDPVPFVPSLGLVDLEHAATMPSVRRVHDTSRMR